MKEERDDYNRKNFQASQRQGQESYNIYKSNLGFPGGSVVKNLPAMWEMWVRSISGPGRFSGRGND